MTDALTRRRSSRTPLNLLLALCLTFGALLTRPVDPASAARTFYVSRSGSNGDGLSWNTAWNELSRINWGAVQPGDTILIDGGDVPCPAMGPSYNCGMVYNSTLNVGKSGTQGAPITIRLANEPGRNGAAIIDGGITSWSQCSDYAPEPTPPATPNGAGTRQTGIDLGTSQWVLIDGTKWGGFEVRNHTRYGLSLDSSQNVLARYLKIHHNTDPTDTTNGAAGINGGYLSRHNTVARVEVFRNGQDGLRAAGDNFTLEESYIHDHYCNHPDGIQSFVPTSHADVPDNAGEVSGLIVRRNVFDKIGMQSIFLGENDGHNSWNVDVAIHDNLFMNTDYVIKSKHGSSRNWLIYNNTIINVADLAVEWCCASPGAQAPMTISNNIFFNVNDGRNGFYLPTGGGNTAFSNNCLHRAGRRAGNVSETGSVTGDPGFADAGSGNFALGAASPCAGKGANMTSVATLLALGCATAQANPPPAGDPAPVVAIGPYRLHLPIISNVPAPLTFAAC